MRIEHTPLDGICVIHLDRKKDERGFFARSFCQEEFLAAGLELVNVQCSVSFNRARGILRGLHYQADPHPEAKLVRVTQGAIFDVAVDLRPDSPTHRDWFAIELNAENRDMLYIGAGFAHGFQTLTDSTEIFYQISSAYHPELTRGVRWNDPAFGIEWPLPNEAILSRADRSREDYLL